MARSTRGRTGTRRRKTRQKKGRAGRLSRVVSLAAVVAILTMGVAWWWSRSSGEPTGPGPTGGAPSKLEVEVFFGNSAKDPQSLDCSRVYPVHRSLPATEAVARAAMEALLRGPSADESKQGYFTSLNRNVPVRSLEVRDGTAWVDFGAGFEEGVAGSCRIESMRAQVERTLLQFDSVRSVRITVQGREATALQP